MKQRLPSFGSAFGRWSAFAGRNLQTPVDLLHPCDLHLTVLIHGEKAVVTFASRGLGSFYPAGGPKGLRIAQIRRGLGSAARR